MLVFGLYRTRLKPIYPSIYGMCCIGCERGHERVKLGCLWLHRGVESAVEMEQHDLIVKFKTLQYTVSFNLLLFQM